MTRDVRIEIEVAPEHKRLLQQAANLSGVTLPQFVIRAAAREAEAVVAAAVSPQNGMCTLMAIDTAELNRIVRGDT